MTRLGEYSDNLRHRYVTDEEILRGWKRGLDTAAIASKYFVPEHVVANRLPRILLAERSTHGDARGW